LIVELPNFQIYRIIAKEDRILKRPTRIHMDELLDENSVINLQNAIGYLENKKEQEVVLIAKVKSKKINCNYLKLIMGIDGLFYPDENQLNIVCEWIY